MASSPKKTETLPADPSQLAAGTLVDGRYKVLRVIGVGGTGVVYEVEHQRTGQHLALKTLLDPSHAPRLEQEARALAKLSSPHIVKVVDLGTHAPPSRLGAKEPPNPFMVMTLLHGRNLRELLETKERLDVRFVANVIVQVCEGLAEAHAAGLIHRDLKPDNVHLSVPANHLSVKGQGTADLDVKSIAKEIAFATVFDFGVVKLAAAELNNPLTRTGSTVGTPYYMSLEQLRGSGTVDAQTDIYALSVMAYECLASARPFEAGTLGDLIFAICSTSPKGLREVRADVPAELDSIVMRGLSREKGERPHSMREVAEVFAPFADAAFTLWLREGGLVRTITSSSMAALPPSLAAAASIAAIVQQPSALTTAAPVVAPAIALAAIVPPFEAALRPSEGATQLRPLAPLPPRPPIPANPLPPLAPPPVPLPPPSPSRPTAPSITTTETKPTLPLSTGVHAVPARPSPPDRETPTEMFVADTHGDGQDIDAPTSVARMHPLESSPNNEDRTAVLTLAEVGFVDPPTQPVQSLMTPNAPVFGSPRVSLPQVQTQQISADLLAPARSLADSRRGVAELTESQRRIVQQRADVTSLSMRSPKAQPDVVAVFLEKVRVSVTEGSFKARMKFRTASAEQQIMVVAVGTALMAVFIVLLFWLIFL